MPRQYTPRVECVCRQCGASFSRPASVMKKPGSGQFCSNTCRGNAWKGENSPVWRGGNVTRECERCGASFVTRATLVRVGRGRFCSLSCGSSQPKPRKKPSPGIKMAVFECRHCGTLFEREPAVAAHGRGVYCSRACYEARARQGRTRLCALCGAPFESYNRKRIYCSRSCVASARIGPKGSRWKGGPAACNYGKRSARQIQMIQPRYRAWRKAVLARDGQTCQRCGRQGGTLHAHHRAPWATNPTLRYDVSNGETLCVQCHRITHMSSKISSL